MKWAKASAKKIALAAVSVVTVASFGLLFFQQQPAEAAPLSRWVNRFYIQVGDKYYYDQNTYDDKYEYVEQGASDMCADKVIFTFMQFGRPTSASNTTNLEFFYNDRIYSRSSADTGDVMFKKQLVTRTPIQNSMGRDDCNESTEDISPGGIEARRIVFYVRDSDNKIVHAIKDVSFSQRGSYPDGTANTRYFRDDELASDERCVDMIIRHQARLNEDDSLFGTREPAGSAILFAVDDRGNLGREAESYGPNSGRDSQGSDPIGRNECKVDTDRVNGRSSSNAYGLAGLRVNGDDKKITAAGLNSNGSNATGGDYRDDAFIIFIGSETANAAKDASGATLPPPESNPDGTINEEVCRGGALGWVICPIVSGIRSTADTLRAAMEVLLSVNPLSLDPDDALYKVWDNIRNFTNILFVIGFLFIIFSQATSIGISNHGIKRLLPNIVVAIVLSNVSYFLFAFAIDVFNILGVGVYNLIAIINDSNQGRVDVSNGAGAILVGLAAAGAGAAFYTGAVVQLFPLLVAAFVGMVLTFLILLLRQALIVIITAASSLIIAGKLKVIPGLESIADKALGTYVALLALYPGIMALFGGARLIESTLTQTAGDGLLGAAKQALPLASTIVVCIVLIKGVFLAASFKRFSALASAMGKVTDRAKGLTNKAEDRAKNSGYYQRRSMARDAKAAERKRANVEDYANRINDNKGWRGRMLRRRAAGGLGAQIVGGLPGSAELKSGAQSRIGIAAQTQLDKLEQQEINDAAFVLRRLNIQSPGELRKIAAGQKADGTDKDGNVVTVDAAGDTAMQRAAMKQIIGAQDAGELETLFKDSGVNHRALVNEIQQQYSTAKGAGAHLVQLEPRTYTADQLQTKAVEALSELSYQKLAGQDAPAVKSALEGFTKGSGSLEARRRLYDAAEKALDTPTVIDNAKAKVRKSLEDITAGPRP